MRTAPTIAEASERDWKGNELGLCWPANRKNLDNRIHVRGGDRSLGVASTKVLKGVMEADKQGETSPEKSSGEAGGAPTRRGTTERSEQEGSVETRATEGEAKKAHPLG